MAVPGRGVLTRRSSSGGLSADQGAEGHGWLGFMFGMWVSPGRWVYKVYAKKMDAWDILWE